jgi:hypothetical protein
MKRRALNLHRIIQVSVLAAFGTIAAGHIWSALTSVRRQDDRELVEIAERNEQSTPRSFILPATPGVALEQERQKRQNGSAAITTDCLAKLRERGVSIAENEADFDVKLVEAVFELQRQIGLPATGKLDDITQSYLRCRS